MAARDQKNRSGKQKPIQSKSHLLDTPVSRKIRRQERLIGGRQVSIDRIIATQGAVGQTGSRRHPSTHADTSDVPAATPHVQLEIESAAALSTTTGTPNAGGTLDSLEGAPEPKWANVAGLPGGRARQPAGGPLTLDVLATDRDLHPARSKRVNGRGCDVSRDAGGGDRGASVAV
jgi:hypothetical protein